MHPRILSALEEKQIRGYLKADGEKNLSMRVLAFRAKKFFPKIKADLDLLEKLLTIYTK
jgi:hypothetical protein